MLIYSMSVSVDGFIADREGAFGWTAPDEEQFRFHIAEVGELGGYLCGRRLYETMLVWETDPQSPKGTPVAASARTHKASARLAPRRAPGLTTRGALPTCV
jgi:dihydrofolate reductase